MHRDIRLATILVQDCGYIKIADYTWAVELKPDAITHTFCGSPEYFAPEMINNEGHDYTLDWWSLGIALYELLIGVSPFFHKERKIMLYKIKNTGLQFPDRRKYKIDYSDEFVDFVTNLLEKDRSKRCRNDSVEILAHPWFDDVDLAKIYNKKMESPLIMNFDEII